MKYVFITGGASGLGRMMCTTLAKRGYTVFAADVNEEQLKTFTEERIIPLVVDITSDESVTNAYNEIVKVTNTLDAIINCAGIGGMTTLIETDPKFTERIVDINLLGMMRVNKTLFPLIKDNKGRIVTISSECGWMSPSPFNGPYTISKYAVEAYNDSLRRELNFLGIKVIKIQPGSFKTNMHNDTRKSFEELKERTAYFKDVVSKMGGMMEKELREANDPVFLMDSVIEALESKDPKISYRVKNSKSMKFLNMFSEETIDSLYLKNLK